MADREDFMTVTTHSQMEWKIKNFVSLQTRPDFRFGIRSKRFRLCNVTWRIHVYPVSYMKQNGLAIYLSKASFSTAKALRVVAAIGIKKADGSVLYRKHELLEFPGCSKVHNRARYLNRVFFSSKDWFPNGKLTIMCNMSHEGAAFRNVISSEKNDSTLAQNLLDLFLNESETDVTFKIKGQQFKAHRLILLARSTVFAAMFRQDMTERHSGVVEIIDCEPSLFKDFLVYLYTGKMDHVVPGNVIDLYTIADKYAVLDLKVMCVKRMRLSLSVDSICDVIMHAKLYNESKLLQNATDFFINNMKEIVKTEKWLEFQRTNDSLVTELFMKTSDFMKRFGTV